MSQLKKVGPPTLLHSYNGISDNDFATLSGSPNAVTPPDQGLCAGRDYSLPGAPAAVFEAVNLVVRETTPSGALLRPDVLLGTFMNDQTYQSDPRCMYDQSTKTFFFTDIGANSITSNYTTDVEVLNASGFASYQFDSSLGGACLPDQPKTGFDNNALVISTDQYCASYEGALVIGISKSQLVAEAATVNSAFFGPVSLGGVPVTGLDPAINTGTDKAYFVNSFPYDANGNLNTISTSLGVWTLTGGKSITTGTGTTTLTGSLIPSEQYAAPVPAASTGNGTYDCSTGLCIYSEPTLNPDDSRMSGPVEVSSQGDDSGLRLWTAISTAVNIPGDPSARDAAAWFEVNPKAGKVVGQGYVAIAGSYMLFPAISPPQSGSAADMVFTLTNSTTNPSAAFTTTGSKTVTTLAAGAGPHMSFTEGFNEAPRWGDYSWAVPDPNGNGVWVATEYIPPTADQNPFDNWGTWLAEVKN